MVPADSWEGAGEKKRRRHPERSRRALDGKAMRSMEWGPNACSTRFQEISDSVASRCDTVQEGASAGLALDGM